jgi:hypothetical protein
MGKRISRSVVVSSVNTFSRKFPEIEKTNFASFAIEPELRDNGKREREHATSHFYFKYIFSAHPFDPFKWPIEASLSQTPPKSPE